MPTRYDIVIMTVIPSTTASTTVVRTQITGVGIHRAPNTDAIGSQSAMGAKPFRVTNRRVDIRPEEVGNIVAVEDAKIRAVARIIGVVVGRTSATKATAKAGMAVMVAQAQSAVTVKA